MSSDMSKTPFTFTKELADGLLTALEQINIKLIHLESRITSIETYLASTQELTSNEEVN